MTFSPQPKHLRGATLAAAAVSAALLASCASPGLPPTAELATARNSIAKAESASALESAPLELRAARDKLAMAEAQVKGLMGVPLESRPDVTFSIDYIPTRYPSPLEPVAIARRKA